jgi:alkylhydroperoxidase family enzyme
MTRIPPVEPPYPAEIQAAFDRVMPPGVPPLVLFRTLARNPRVLARVMAGGLLDRGSISLRERELVILRTTWRCGAEYEWGVHVAVYGGKVGWTAAELAAITSEDAHGMIGRDRLLVGLCDELHAAARIGDALWRELAATWTPDQLVELVVLAGFYHAIAFVANAFELEREPFAARFVG